ncbi:MAG: phosphotransferase family protein [Saprospiraceae bacterium]|nr:phosphotransferase family protein [Lewinella sp.]
MSVSLPQSKLARLLYEQQLIDHPDSELEITQFPGGFSNLTYRLAIEGKTFVLRRPPVGAIKRGHDMGREYKVLSHLYPVFNKVPKTFYYTEDDALIGAPFYIMEEVQGIILHDEKVKNSDTSPDSFAQIAESWLTTFVELHQLDYREAGLSELGKPEGYISRQVFNWGKQYLKAATDDIPEAQQVMEWMETHQPKEVAHSLIHNDYKYNNVVFADDSWREIRAILDWEMCTLGDPLMDLGTSLGYWVTADDPVPLQMLSNSPTILPGNPSRNEIVQRYATLSGNPIRHLTFYYVYGLFKIAVIVQQIYYRYRAGYTQDARFAHLNKFTEVLFRTAWRAVQRDRIE